ncbi:transposable element Tcb2 transposase [Trichonephila clavipes]|nr:transposable element Tcb2 transposase [Trichonephila clavipes]
MDWPARSPDLNPIEHVWDFLGKRLAARTLPPVTIRKLRLTLQDEWAAMPQQLIDTLILSMGRRCETCLEGYLPGKTDSQKTIPELLFNFQSELINIDAGFEAIPPKNYGRFSPMSRSSFQHHKWLFAGDKTSLY